MSVSVIHRGTPPVGKLGYEVVERKGVGHPDTMCDAIAEKCSQLYSRFCLEHYNGIAHHWFDKVMLMGGEANIDFNFGELTRPYRVYIVGKGAKRVGAKEIPVLELFKSAASEVLRSVLTGFDAERHLEVHDFTVDHQGVGRGGSRYRPRGPEDLEPLVKHGRVSNDCNVLSAFAPFTTLESMVHSVERHLTGTEYKARNPQTGWDVKVVGRRSGEKFDLLVNMPFLARDIGSMDEYWERKRALVQDLKEFTQQKFGFEPNLEVNTTDKNGRPYLTVLGSVADSGDIGVVGRGNRASGLITPMRPMSIEAPSGKNPLDHTGKIYTRLAQDIAEDVHATLRLRNEVHIVTSKEAPLEQPDDVVVAVEEAPQLSDLRSKVDEIIERHMASVASLTKDLVFGERPFW